MGSLYCPNCSKAISELAVIPACPNCYHPFNARIWRETHEKKQKEAEMEYQRKQEQSEIWKKKGRCEYCGGRLKTRQECSDYGGSGVSYHCEVCYRENYDVKGYIGIF